MRYLMHKIYGRAVSHHFYIWKHILTALISDWSKIGITNKYKEKQ